MTVFTNNYKDILAKDRLIKPRNLHLSTYPYLEDSYLVILFMVYVPLLHSYLSGSPWWYCTTCCNHMINYITIQSALLLIQDEIYIGLYWTIHCSTNCFTPPSNHRNWSPSMETSAIDATITSLMLTQFNSCWIVSVAKMFNMALSFINLSPYWSFCGTEKWSQLWQVEEGSIKLSTVWR